MPSKRLLLGIDPGSRRTGYGIIDVTAGSARYVASGCVVATRGSLPERLGTIFEGIAEVIAAHRPTEVAIENVFVAKNPRSALVLGQARGAAIAAVVAAGLSVNEYAAREVKLAVVGTGRASKDQVQHMVQVLLELSGRPQADAADALAIALCHSNTSAAPTAS